MVFWGGKVAGSWLSPLVIIKKEMISLVAGDGSIKASCGDFFVGWRYCNDNMCQEILVEPLSNNGRDA